MNTQLEKLYEQYSLSPKDRYEINQIYSLLPMHKQRNILQNFPVLASKLKKIETELREERELLMGSEINHLESILLRNRKEKVKEDIHKLKQEI
ncbi:MAG: hypothetical protein GY828_03025 [Candidatus Gracilibacteria bacterium]|nr:hypothetical protein [Candidatus Gracilibacteria bacterium]